MSTPGLPRLSYPWQKNFYTYCQDNCWSCCRPGVSIFLLMGSIAAAIAIGNMLHNSWLGFLIMGAIYLLLGLIIWGAKDRLLRIPIMNAIIDSLFSRDKNHEKD